MNGRFLSLACRFFSPDLGIRFVLLSSKQNLKLLGFSYEIFEIRVAGSKPPVTHKSRSASLAMVIKEFCNHLQWSVSGICPTELVIIEISVNFQVLFNELLTRNHLYEEI